MILQVLHDEVHRYARGVSSVLGVIPCFIELILSQATNRVTKKIG
jgi:hypothetical protein